MPVPYVPIRPRDHGRNVLEIVEAGDKLAFLEQVTWAVQRATCEASEQSHALGLDVADGRAENG